MPDAPRYAISISEEPELVLSEELLRMEPEVRRRLEQEVARSMQIEALLFSAPSGFSCIALNRDDQPFVFYRRDVRG